MPAHHVCSMIFIHVEYLRFGNQSHHEPNEMTEWYAVIDYTIPRNGNFQLLKMNIFLEDYQDHSFLLLGFLLNIYSAGWQRTPLWCQEMWKERLNISSSLQPYSMCLHSCTRQIQTSITDSQGKKSLNENYLRNKKY